MAIINALGYSDYDFFKENYRGSQVYTVGVKCENFANKKVPGKKLSAKLELALFYSTNWQAF
jgi:hypothetical protein